MNGKNRGYNKNFFFKTISHTKRSNEGYLNMNNINTNNSFIKKKFY